VTSTLTLVPRGPFSLRAAAGFGFGPTEGRPPSTDPCMRLAFAVDGGRGHAGVVLRQDDEDGPVRAELHGDGDPASVERQIERILSLDHDGREFVAIGARDRVLGRLQQAHPGQRPVLFNSPYEAAAWSVISARRPASQAAQVRRALSESLGAIFELVGERTPAFPQPAALLEVQPMTGLPEEKVVRLRGVVEAALEGRLDAERLRALGPEGALEETQRLRGIGPFYSGLIVLRATGFADAMLPVAEPKLLRHAARYYQLDAPPTLEQFIDIAAAWRPFRTWAAVLLRLAGDRGTP
jgi:DNA-3-methyladenine glycosylase II